MPLYLVRHAKAVSRQAWDGDDDEQRPLTKAGMTQAEGISRWLSRRAVPCILSSPSLRCTQTVEPLALRLDLKVEATEVLAEGTRFERVLELLDSLPEHSVLCSHGDVIVDTVEALVRRKLMVKGHADWRKGATWVLERHDGEFVSGRVMLAPNRH